MILKLADTVTYTWKGLIIFYGSVRLKSTTAIRGLRKVSCNYRSAMGQERMAKTMVKLLFTAGRKTEQES